MKRVLIFSLAYFPHVGGAEVAVKEITDRVPSAEIEFHMITLRFNRSEASLERIGNVQVHRVGWGGRYAAKILFIPLAALRARLLARTVGFDGMWAIMSYMLWPIVLLRMFGLSRPYLLTLQEGDPWDRAFGRWFILPFRPLLSYGFRRATAVQAISNYLAAWAKRMGYPGDPQVVPNGVDIRRFVGVSGPHETGRTILVSTSRLVRKNGLDDIIRALVHLPESVRLRLYGIGPEERSLKTLAQELSVLDRVEFKGHIDHSVLPGALAACDIFVRPSRSEGMGNSFIEAMAAGLPVIATQEGGIADFLFDSKKNPDKPSTGWAVDVGAPEEIANAVKEILSDPVKTQKVRENAFRLVEERYDWELVAARMGDVFDRLTGHKATP